MKTFLITAGAAMALMATADFELVTSPNRRQASARASGTDDEIYGNANGDADGPGR